MRRKNRRKTGYGFQTKFYVFQRWGSVRALCMAAPCVLASGGQDKTIRVWDLRF
jgi:hypothetical protein